MSASGNQSWQGGVVLHRFARAVRRRLVPAPLSQWERLAREGIVAN